MSYRRRAAMLAGAIVTTVACGAEGSPVKGPVSKADKPHVDKVHALAKGSCVVVYAEDCPEGEPCPPETYGKEPIPCPDGLAGGKGWLRLSHYDGNCDVMHEVECPPDATCNPPPPEDIACPKRYRPPEPTVRIDRREDGTCWEMVQGNCPPSAKCNPPPPRKVDCPPEDEKPAPE